MSFNIENRRYIGSKAKLMPKIVELVLSNTKGNSFFDVFSGTGVVSKYFLEHYDTFILNDLLYSNEIIYRSFFESNNFDIISLKSKINSLLPHSLDNISENYFSDMFGGKYFSYNDAKLIGFIREIINNKKLFNRKEKEILLTSLIYSADRVANTVGHYEAYIKGKFIQDRFQLDLIRPLNTINKNISIYRQDANLLINRISSDIAFIDPPYNSRQYSRFYHVLDNLTQWDKPELFGTALKPKEQNMSEYCRVKAPIIFDELVKNINAKFLVVTYNNTYTSKSKSSQNKISHEQILSSLANIGKTKIFELPHSHFNAGKSSLDNHKEFVFITEKKHK